MNDKTQSPGGLCQIQNEVKKQPFLLTEKEHRPTNSLCGPTGFTHPKRKGVGHTHPGRAQRPASATTCAACLAVINQRADLHFLHRGCQIPKAPTQSARNRDFQTCLPAPASPGGDQAGSPTSSNQVQRWRSWLNMTQSLRLEGATEGPDGKFPKSEKLLDLFQEFIW